MNTSLARLSVGAVVIATLAGVVSAGCADAQVTPQEVTDLRLGLEEARAGTGPKGPTTVVPLRSLLGASLETAGYRLGELTSEELVAFQATDGFAITREKPTERLVVVGSAEAIAQHPLGDLNSYSVVVDVRIIDPVSGGIRANNRSSTQVMGINAAVALANERNQAKLDPMRTALIATLTAP
jgi:hypothetical protein